MYYSEIEVTADDLTKIFVRLYRVSRTRSESSRMVVLVHGIMEHGGRYDHVARLFTEGGWDVVVADLRGHGRSGGVRTHVDKFCRYLEDLDCVWKQFDLVAERTVLFGHSFGALVSIRYAQTRVDKIALLILASPLLASKVFVDPLTLVFGKLMSIVAPKVRFRSRIDPADTTRSQDTLKRRAADTLMQTSVTAGWFFQMRSALGTAWSEAERVQTPLLALQAGSDRIVDPLAVLPWFQKVRSPDKRYEMFDEHLHELLNEPDWRRTAETILNWMNQRLSEGIDVWS